MKSNPQQLFENLVGAAIKKLKDFYTAGGNKEGLDKLTDLLSTRVIDVEDRTSKQLDANRYFYLFELMCESRQPQLVEDSLGYINVSRAPIQSLIGEKFLNVAKDVAIEKSLLAMLQKSLLRLPQLAASILIQIRIASLETLQMLFQAYPRMRLFDIVCSEATQQRIRTAVLSILARVFSFRRKELSVFTHRVYQLYQPLIPIVADFELVTEQEQRHILSYYVGKVLSQVVTKVQLSLSSEDVPKGKFGLCFMCRAPADYYCKDTKVSVCGADCKKNHLQQVNKVSWLANSHSLEEMAQFEEFLSNKYFSKAEQMVSRLLALQCLVEVMLCSEYTPRLGLQLIPQPAAGIAQMKKIQCMLVYLHCQQQQLMCDQVFYELMLHSEQQSEYRLLAQAYFKELFSDDRVFLAYFNFDLQPNRINLIRDVLVKSAKQSLRPILSALINNVYAQNQKLFEDKEYEFVEEQHEIISVFNGNTEKGCEMLRKKYPEEQRNRSIAIFFRKNEKSLSRERLGEFFARNNQQSQNVLHYFLELLNLNSLEIDDALREVFYHFSVSESQQIFRIIEGFSKLYSTAKLPNPDELFAFAYFILMLQTELHSPAIEKRMSLQEMLSRVAAFNPALATNKQYLGQIYYNIKSKPFSKSQKKVRYNNFEQIKKLPLKDYSKALILYHNWLPIYNWLATETSFANKQLIYRTCFVLIRFEVAQHFLHLLTRELSRVDMLVREITQQQAFLVSSVLTLMWHQPNHVRGQWRQVLDIMVKYKILLDTVAAHKQQNLPISYLDGNYQKLRLYLSETQIERLFQLSRDFTVESLELFASALATVSDGCFLSRLALLIELNSTRLEVIWAKLLAYINLHTPQNQIHTFSQILVTLGVLTSRSGVDETVQRQSVEYATQVIKILTETPQLSTYSANLIAHLLTSANFSLHPELWTAITRATLSMIPEHRLEFAKFLQGSNAKLYEELVVQTMLRTESVQFMKHHLQLIQAKPPLFEQHLPTLKNRQLVKLFVLPQYKDYVLNNLATLGTSPELSQLLRSEIPNMAKQQLQKVHSFAIEHLKHADTDLIQVIVALLTTELDVKVIDLVSKLMDMCDSPFPEVSRQVKLGVEDKPTDTPSFKLNYSTVVKKTVMELTLLKAIQDVHAKLSMECLVALQPLIEGAVRSSRSFNRNIVLRWQLWKDGLLKELKQLPGLMKKERSSLTLMLSILELQSQKSGSYHKYVEYVQKLYTDMAQRLELYIQHNKFYRSCPKDDLNYYFFSEIEREAIDTRKIASRVLADLTKVDWSTLDKGLRVRLLRAITDTLKSGLYKFAESGYVFEVSAQEEQLSRLHQSVLESL